MEPPSPIASRKSLRVSVAPSATNTADTRRASRSAVPGRRQSRSLERRGSINSLKGLPEVVEPKPSPTVLRLKSLARAVRASQALGTLRVSSKYALSMRSFATDEMYHTGMLSTLDDTSMLSTAPWARDIKSDRLESTEPHLPFSAPTASTRAATLASTKSRVRWKSASQQAVAASSDTAIKAPLRRGNDSLTAKSALTKSSMKRLGSIRGDLNAMMNAPTEPLASTHPAATAARRTKMPENLDARISCARSLYKLSCQLGSELAIIQSGAVTQIADFSDIEHPKLLRYCAATLANLTTERSVIDAFVRCGGIQALLELSWAPCLHVKILCATALCRITQHATLAPALVRARVIIELLSMLALPHGQLQVLVVSSILNLVYHGQLFPDRVFLGEPHASQSQIGVMSVVSQLATASDSTIFATEVLYNLSLYHTSCAGALRGGGAELLHALAALVCKVIEETGTASTRFMAATSTPVRTTRPTWANNTPVVMRLLHLISETLGNYSAYVEFHSVLSSYSMKTLSLLLFGALRDVGSKLYGAVAEARLKHTVVACSRALANFSANDDLRKHAFSQDIVHMTTRLTLLDRQRSLASPLDARVFFRNIVRTICNLSFSDTCTAYFMEFPQMLPLLHSIAITVQKHTDPAAEPAVAGEDVKEDALVTILNLAQQAAYANDLVRILDGKQLAFAAEDPSHSGRLKYVYSLVLCNLLFESRLQQIVYGDLVIHSLIYGFYFFGAPADDSATAAVTATATTSEQMRYKAMNLAFGDDQERFLAAICIMASEIMDPANIERIIRVILDCLKRPVEPAAATATTALTTADASGCTKLHHHHHQQQRPTPIRSRQITGFAAAALYTLARASTQRGDTHNLIHSPEIEDALIAVCERGLGALPSTGTSSGGGGDAPTCAGYCGTTQAFCAASLYHLCASGYVSRRIIQALITCCNANEETLSLLACAASFAIISFTPEGRSELIACAHLAKALNRLGRTSQPECQQYAAIAACNVSTLECIWTSTELKDFIVMALLRANSVQAKQIHAKTLSNLLAHVSTREKAVEDGVLYALMKLSQVMHYRSTSVPPPSSAGHSGTATPLRGGSDFIGGTSPRHGVSTATDALKYPASATAPVTASSMDEVFSIGLQALFNLSCEHQYHQRLLSNGVMAYLAAPVAGKHASTVSAAQLSLQDSADHLLSASSFLLSHTTHQSVACQLSVESRRCAMGILCNLSSYEENHKELMHSQVSDIIRKYVDQDIETRASAAMALRNLSCSQPWVEMLCERKTLHLFIGFTQCDHHVVKQFGVEALANCSLITDSLHLYSELRVARAVLVVLEKVSSAMTRIEQPIGAAAGGGGTGSDDSDSNGTSSMATAAAVDQLDVNMETCMAALKCLHNIAFDDALAVNLLDEHAVLGLLSLLEHRALGDDEDVCLLTATLVHILAGKPRCAEQLLQQRVVSLCARLHAQHGENLHIAFECVGILLKLSTYQQVQEALAETQAIHVVVSICSSPGVLADARIRECGAITIRNLTLSVTEHLSLFYGESGLDGDGVTALSALQSDRGSASTRSPAKLEYSSADLEDFDTDTDIDSGSNSGSHMSRLIERHLLHGVRYFQHELNGVADASERAGDANAGTGASDRIVYEACAGIANLSTIRSFRIAMVHLGIVDTLLRVYQLSAAQTGSAQTVSATLLQRMCAATLHRLAVEDEAGIDELELLVPSLLSILTLSDEELHHVRYECEKVSLYQPQATSRSRRQARVQIIDDGDGNGGSSRSSRALSQPKVKVMTRRGNIMIVGGSAPTAAGLAYVSLAATTHCVKQMYREQKWMLFMLKTTLSSASMIPQLEKKQMKVIGMPRLALQDIAESSVSAVAINSSKYSAAALSATTAVLSPSWAATASSSDSSDSASAGAGAGAGAAGEVTTKLKGGYLLPVHMDKYKVQHDECTGGVDMGPMRFGLGDTDDDDDDDIANRMYLSGASITVVDTIITPLINGDSPDWAALLQSRKFDRHMRTTRRNHRHNPNSSPVLSMLG